MRLKRIFEARKPLKQERRAPCKAELLPGLLTGGDYNGTTTGLQLPRVTPAALMASSTCLLILVACLFTARAEISLTACDHNETARIAWSNFMSSAIGGDDVRTEAHVTLGDGEHSNVSEPWVTSMLSSMLSSDAQASVSAVESHTLKHGIAIMFVGQSRTFYLPEVYASYTNSLIKPLKLDFPDSAVFTALTYSMTYSWHKTLPVEHENFVNASDEILHMSALALQSLFDAWKLPTFHATEEETSGKRQNDMTWIAWQAVRRYEQTRGMFKYVLSTRPDLMYSSSPFYPLPFHSVGMIWDFAYFVHRRFGNIMAQNYLTWQDKNISQCDFPFWRKEDVWVKAGTVTRIANFKEQLHARRHGIPLTRVGKDGLKASPVRPMSATAPRPRKPCVTLTRFDRMRVTRSGQSTLRSCARMTSPGNSS